MTVAQAAEQVVQWPEGSNAAPALFVTLSLRETLPLKLLPMWLAAPCMAAVTIDVWMGKWEAFVKAFVYRNGAISAQTIY